MGSLVQEASEPAKSNRSCLLLRTISGVLMGFGLWRGWFHEEITDEEERMMLTFFGVWLAALFYMSRDPGWINSSNVDVYLKMWGDEESVQRQVCSHTGLPKPARSALSKGTLQLVARFDHHNQWIGVDVGLKNYISYHVFMAITCMWCFAIWTTTMNIYADQVNWTPHRPWWFPIIAWELFLLAWLAGELYCRFFIFLYSIGSLAVRHFFGEFSFLLSLAFTIKNVSFGLYYVPVLIGCALAYYCFGYTLIVLVHAFFMTASNMTVHEEMVLCEHIAVLRSTWNSMTGLVFLVWTEIVGGFMSVVLFERVEVVDSEENVPEGYILLHNTGFWSAFGTLPTMYSQYDLGTVKANFLELWNCSWGALPKAPQKYEDPRQSAAPTRSYRSATPHTTAIDRGEGVPELLGPGKL
eukprot:gene11675-18001_t